MLVKYLENPPLALCIFVACIILMSVLKVSAKVTKWVIICGIVYVGINFLSLV